MSRISLVARVLAVLWMASSPSASSSSYGFEGHTFTLELPAGYMFQAVPSPRPGFKTFGFSTDPRSDGTRAMIQVSLLDFSSAPAGKAVSLEKLAAAMIQGVAKRRSRWEQTESDVKIAGVSGKRIAWAGTAEPGFGRPAVHMRGVMIVGIKKSLGFTLHTQDRVAFADESLPIGEKALQTFALTLRR